MSITTKTPHRPPPTSVPTAPLPMPPLVAPPNLNSGYNPSTSSSPLLHATSASPIITPSISPAGLPLPSPAPISQPSRLARSDGLAPPRLRVSRSASPLGRNREPTVPVMGEPSDGTVSEIVRKEMARLPSVRLKSPPTSPTGVTPAAIASIAQSTAPSLHQTPPALPAAPPLPAAPTLTPQPPRTSSPPTRTGSPPVSRVKGLKSTATTLARTATMGRSGSLTRAFNGKGRSTPPPINVPVPPVPEVPSQWRDSTVISASTASTIPSRHASSISQASQYSNTSSGSSYRSDSYRSSVDSETAAISRTLSATASIKGNKSVKEKKRSRFLGKRKKDEGVIAKPLISPPTLVHTESTSALPRLRNRESMGAKGPVVDEDEKERLRDMEMVESGGNVGEPPAADGIARVDVVEPPESSMALPLMGDKARRSSKASEIFVKPRLKKSETGATTASTETKKLKKSRTFGLPWVKGEKRAPEAHDDLVEGGFFTRTQLPPVKYTRLPVLAVSGADLEKAGAEGVRVSMQLAPMVWYDEQKRKTVRMSLQMAQEGADGTKRTSWIPANRFSWLPGQEDSLSRLASPLGSARSLKKSPMKSPLASAALGSVGEEDEDEGDAIDLEEKRRAAAAKLEGAIDTPGAKSIDQILATSTPAKSKARKNEVGADVKDGDDDGKLVVRSAPTSQRASTQGPPVPVRSSSEEGTSSTLIHGELRVTNPEHLSDTEAEIDDDCLAAESADFDLPEHTIRWSEGTNDDARELRMVLEQIAEEQAREHNGLPGSARLQQPSNDAVELSSKRISLSIKKLAQSLAAHPDDEEDEEAEVASADRQRNEIPVQSNNRTSWLFNSGAPPPQNMKILAAVPKDISETASDSENEDGQNANVELRILSAYNLPEQAQVLAVIAEEDEEQTMAHHATVDGDTNNDAESAEARMSRPMSGASFALPNMRMIGVAEVAEDLSSEEKPSTRDGQAQDASDSESSYSQDDEHDTDAEDNEESDVDKKPPISNNAQVQKDAQGTADVESTEPSQVAESMPIEDQPEVSSPPPLQIRPKSDGSASPAMGSLTPYVPGPIRLSHTGNMYRNNSIAGMDVWNDNDTTESAWQRSEKGLIDGILDFFADTVSTSETWCGVDESPSVDDEDIDFSFLKAPLLDDAFIRLHAVEDIFAEIIDPSKPPPLPPLPTDFIPNRPLSSPGFEYMRSPESTRSMSMIGPPGSMTRASTQRKPKTVAVHSPGIGTLLMKRGLF